MSFAEHNLYLVERPPNLKASWDTYRSFVVSARSEDLAREIHPSFTKVQDRKIELDMHDNDYAWEYQESAWVSRKDIDQLIVSKIGVANIKYTKVFCTDFLAG